MFFSQLHSMTDVSVRIVNMPHRRDRRQSMTRLMAACGIDNYAFVVPKSGATPTDSLYQTTERILEDAADAADVGGPRVVLILEDDLGVAPGSGVRPADMRGEVDALLAAVPPDWDLIKLEVCFAACNRAARVSDTLRKTRDSLCAGAVLYNAARVRRSVLPHLRTYRRRLLVAPDEVLKDSDLAVYHRDPPLFTQLDHFGSDIPTSDPWKPVCKAGILSVPPKLLLLLLLLLTGGAILAWRCLRR